MTSDGEVDLEDDGWQYLTVEGKYELGHAMIKESVSTKNGLKRKPSLAGMASLYKYLRAGCLF